MAPANEAQLSFFEALYAARDADAHEIIGGIHLGAASAATDKQAMRKRKISHVLIVHPKLPEKHPQAFKYGRVPLLDEPEANLLEILPAALAFFGKARAAGGHIFVHCAKGISRSSAVVISMLMFERGISFDEAFKLCESKRPIVYPNVGFQQQLRYLDRLLADHREGGGSSPSSPWAERVERLKQALPLGSLQGPQSPLRIRDSIGESVTAVLGELQALASKVCAQPQLLQKRELWKRHGLFFENLHKYKALPSSSGLVVQAREASSTLKSLPKIFSDSLKGIKLALAVAKELDAWSAFADSVVSNPVLNPKVKEELDRKGARNEDDDEEDPMKAFLGGAAGDRNGEEDKKGKKEKGEKLSKKDKKEEKAQRKAEKAAKKAHKVAEKIAKAATKAEQVAGDSQRAAELAAERAEQLARDIAEAELAELAAARKARRTARGNAAEPGRRPGASGGSSDGSAGGSASEGGGSEDSSGGAERRGPKRQRRT